jgi:aspartokinase
VKHPIVVMKFGGTSVKDIEVEEQKQAKDLLAYVFGDVK